MTFFGDTLRTAEIQVYCVTFILDHLRSGQKFVRIIPTELWSGVLQESILER